MLINEIGYQRASTATTRQTWWRAGYMHNSTLYEARVYQEAPFQSRPDDILSFVAAYRGHSKYVTDRLMAQGKTVWHNSPSVTGSYALHVSPGNYLTLGLGYVRGAAITPRVADTLTLSTNWGMYF